MKTRKKTARTTATRRLAPFCLCGAQTSLHYLQALMAEMEGVRQAEDSECVHRMRVASRRLRSVLPLFTACLSRQTCARWRKQLRRLTRALAAARDTDVQIADVQQFLRQGASAEEHAGAARLLLRLEQRRQELQGPLLEALERFTARQYAEAVEQQLTQVVQQHQSYESETPGRRVYRQIRKGILKRLEAFEAYAPYVSQPECVQELHAMRIAAKRLRYTMQALAPLYPDALAEPIQAARRCQTMLGDIHDCDVWVDTLPRFYEDEQARTLAYFGSTTPFEPLHVGILALQHDRQQQREQSYQVFVTYWGELQGQGVWERLRQTLAEPHAAAETAAEAPEEREAEILTRDSVLAPTYRAAEYPVQDKKIGQATMGTVYDHTSPLC